MLHEFLTANRADLIDRCCLKVAQRTVPKATRSELEHGIPLFLDQLIKTLEVEQTLEPMQSRKVSGASGGDGQPGEIGNAATLHDAICTPIGDPTVGEELSVSRPTLHVHCHRFTSPNPKQLQHCCASRNNLLRMAH